MDYIRAIERQQIREDIPAVRVGDNVKVHYRIVEGDLPVNRFSRAISFVFLVPDLVKLYGSQDQLWYWC